MADFTYRYFNVTFPHEYVVHVEINRPERLNAFHRPMWLELRTIFDRLSTDPSARAVVFSGAGPKAFTAGLDLQAATATGSGSGSGSGPDDVLISDSTASEDVARRATALRRHILDLQDCVSSVERCEKPVICILHGYSLGLGIDLCTSADIRLCTKDVRLSVKEVDIGLAADVGSLSRLPRCVNSSSWVKDVCLTARPFDASEAYRVGLVSAIYDDKSRAFSAAVDLARLIASKSPVAVQGTKEILNSCRDRPLSDGLRYTAVWNAAALQSQDVKSAINASFTLHRTQSPSRPHPCPPRFHKL